MSKPNPRSKILMYPRNIESIGVLSVYFTDDEFSMMLRDEVIEEVKPGRFELTKLGKYILLQS